MICIIGFLSRLTLIRIRSTRLSCICTMAHTCNWSPIDAQLEILRGASYEDYEYEERAVESKAYLAAQWMGGEHEEDLFEV